MPSFFIVRWILGSDCRNAVQALRGRVRNSYAAGSRLFAATCAAICESTRGMVE